MPDHASIFNNKEALAFMKKRLHAIEGEHRQRPCHKVIDKPVGECWCQGAGPNGETLPCPSGSS